MNERALAVHAAFAASVVVLFTPGGSVGGWLGLALRAAVFAALAGAALWWTGRRDAVLAAVLLWAVVGELVRHAVLPGVDGSLRDVAAAAAGSLTGALVTDRLRCGGAPPGDPAGDQAR
ncbi:hypothetical protein [Kineococcus terrestris]|uniref:hypothetical protein n=1 Tax=Kineococcus terrestris TaxID=2044856 RepID=UPI0034DB74B4